MQVNATVENQKILKSTEPCFIQEFDTAHACDLQQPVVHLWLGCNMCCPLTVLEVHNLISEQDLNV